MEAFEEHFETIKRLYIDEGRTAKAVQEILERHYSFPKSKSVLRPGHNRHAVLRFLESVANVILAGRKNSQRGSADLIYERGSKEPTGFLSNRSSEPAGRTREQECTLKMS